MLGSNRKSGMLRSCEGFPLSAIITITIIIIKGVVGDSSDAFSFATFFPAALQPAARALGNWCFALCGGRAPLRGVVLLLLTRASSSSSSSLSSSGGDGVVNNTAYQQAATTTNINNSSRATTTTTTLAGGANNALSLSPFGSGNADGSGGGSSAAAAVATIARSAHLDEEVIYLFIRGS